MISAVFTAKGNTLTGFEISGHSGYAEEGQDIICAAVSSAALMTVNTVTEIQKLSADIAVDDGFLKLDLSPKDAQTASVALEGLRLHLTALSQEHPQFINVTISEV